MRSLFQRFWAWPWELRRHNVLGINERNLEYLFQLNPRSLYRRADDKVVTKTICQEHNIPVPETYAVIERFGDLRNLPKLIGPRQQFVVKPATGAGGRGVLVVERANGIFLCSGMQRTLSWAELRHHISDILSGLYSLAGLPDRVLVEERIVPHRLFEGLASSGTPDIRVVVYQGTPAMAMLRLPSIASRGRANLHQGAVAAGIDLHTGITFGGVHHNRAVSRHPDTGKSIQGLTIPYWREILCLAAKLSALVEMGYVGVDMVLVEQKGPVVLEVNTRPGLAVQTANRCGIKARLRDPSTEHEQITTIRRPGAVVGLASNMRSQGLPIARAMGLSLQDQ